MVLVTWKHEIGTMDYQKCKDAKQASMFIEEQISCGMSFCNLEILDTDSKKSYAIQISLKEVN